MNIDKNAFDFASRAHEGQYRKGQLEGLEKVPYIVHPIDVVEKLNKYGFNDELIISAGYLHDVVEDTIYTLEDINKYFGDKITSYVKAASEEDKSLSWDERKQETINKVKDLDLNHKAIICCDKICNLEDILILSGKTGRINFDSFKRGFDKQKWYYDNIYDSLINGEDSTLKMFRDLKELITLIFEKSIYIKSDYISILKYKKQELLKLKDLFKLDKPNIDEVYLNRNGIDNEVYNFINSCFENVDINIVPSKSTKEYNLDESQLMNFVNGGKTIIDSIMTDLYHETLNEVKRKIKSREL